MINSTKTFTAQFLYIFLDIHDLLMHVMTFYQDIFLALTSTQFVCVLSQHVQLKAELQTAKLKQEQFADYREEADHLREENKQLAQDHAEDQQVIHLLEMQKDILTKGQV